MRCHCRYALVLVVGLATSIYSRPADAGEGESTVVDLEAIWEDFAQPDEAGALRAFENIRILARSPCRAVEFLHPRLRPVPAPDPQHVRRLIADLNSREFARRSAASAELEKLGPLVAPALRNELLRAPSLESVRRIEELQKRADRRPLSPTELQALRAVEALEGIGTPEARQVLEELAGGAAAAEVTQRAKVARDRLRDRR